MNIVELSKLVELLRIVRDEKLDEGVAQMIFERIDWADMSEIHEVFSNLHHYWDDEDIRSREPEYKAMQDGELDKLILHLEKQHWRSANGVSFLHVSTEIDGI